jgi:hypothetical protein
MLNLKFVNQLYIKVAAIDNFMIFIHSNPKYKLYSHLLLNKYGNLIEEPMQLHLRNLYDFLVCRKVLTVFYILIFFYLASIKVM